MKDGRKPVSDAERITLERIGTAPIEERKKRRGRPPKSASMEATFHRLLERRGYQRFYYHVAETTVAHWWDHQEILNNIQADLENVYGQEAELVAVREIRGAGVEGRQLVFHFYFKIGPIPWPD
jgi:hypothetical protein